MALIAHGANISTETIELGKRLAPLDVLAKSQKISILAASFYWAKRSWGISTAPARSSYRPVRQAEPFRKAWQRSASTGQAA